MRIQIWNQKNNLQNLQLYEVPKIPITTSIHMEGILHHEKKMHSPDLNNPDNSYKPKLPL